MITPRRIRIEIIAVIALAGALSVPAQAAAQEGGAVLVVGDSLEVGTGPFLRQELAGFDVTVDARESRPSAEGLAVLQSAISAEHEVVVFDLGTNDDPSNPDGLAANLASVRQIAGDRCIVVATINRPPLNGVSDGGLNSAVSSFAANPNVELADWRSAAASAGVLQPDGVHGTAEGYALRGQLVADAVRSCLAGAGAAPPSPASGGGADRPPKPVGSPRPEFGPGFALITAPALALLDRLVGLLEFATAPIAEVFSGLGRDGGSEP